MGMGLLELRLEAFAAWLTEREHEIVGAPRWCYQNPLAAWLSEVMGGVCGVDEGEGRYGRALWDCSRWLPLPRWAWLFALAMERCRREAVTGHEAFETLAAVELSLAQWTRSGGVSCQKGCYSCFV